MVTPPTTPAVGTADHLHAEDPWPGLDPYREEHASFFFGREAEADELFERISKKSFTLLYAQSGLGKTSLLNAGLYPKLREHDFLPVDLRLDFAAEESLEKQAIRQIHQAFEFLDVAAPQPDDSLWFWLHRKDAQFRTRDGREIKPVFVFDQFEEFFTIGAETDSARERSQGFLEQLADLVENRAPVPLTDALKKDPALGRSLVFVRQDYRILISIREDYLAYVESLALRMPSIGENRMRLVQMNGVQAFQAVNNPGKQITTPLVSRQIVRKVASLRRAQKTTAEQPTDETWEGLQRLRIEPSFLSLVCRELNRWRRLKGFPQLTSELVSTTGAIESILSDFYERCLADQPAAVRLYVEDELLTKSGFRENKSLEDAEDYLKEHGVDPAAVKMLVNRRLLRIDERLDVKRVELTHDILAEVVQASRDNRHAREEKEALERQQREAAEARQVAEKRERETRKRLHLARLAIAVMVALLAWALWNQIKANLEAARANSEAVRANSEAARANAEAARANSEAGRARLEADHAKSAENRAVQSEEKALNSEARAAGMLVGYSYTEWKNGDVWEALRLLEEAKKAPRYAPAWDWYFVKGLCKLSGLGVRQLRAHEGGVSVVVPIPNGHLVASSGFDGEVRVWGAIEGKELKRLVGETHGVGFGFFYQLKQGQGFVVTELMPNGSAASDGRLKVGDRILKVGAPGGDFVEATGLTLEQLGQRLQGEEGTKVRLEVEHSQKGERETIELTRRPFSKTVKHGGRVTHLAVSHDGLRLASVDEGNLLLFWNLEDGRLLDSRQLPESDPVLGLAFSPDRHWLALCGARDKEVFLLNLVNSSPQKIKPVHDQPITAIAFAPDGRLATASDNGKEGVILFWDLEHGQKLDLHFSTDPNCQQLVFAPDGNLLAAKSSQRIKLFDLAQPAKPADIIASTNLANFEFAFHPDSKYLAAAGSDGVVRVWDVRTRKEVRTLVHRSQVNTVAFLSDKLTLASGALDGSIHLWDLRKNSGKAYREFRFDDLIGVSFSPDGRCLAAVGNNQVTIIDVTDGSELRTIPMQGFRTEFSPSESVIAIPNERFEIRLVDAVTGAQVPGSRVFSQHKATIAAIAFGPGGKSFISGGHDGNVFVWDVETGEFRSLRGFEEGSHVTAVAYSPDGKSVAAASRDGQKVCIWEAATGHLVHEIKPTFGLWLRFSPDSKLLATNATNGRIDLTNVETGKLEKSFYGHKALVIDAAFSPDGLRLVTVGDDHATRLWDVESSRKILVLDNEYEFSSVAFSRDGLRLATGSFKTNLRLWDAATLVKDPEKQSRPFYAARSAYYESTANWANVIDSCTTALQLGASDPRMLIRRGVAEAELGQLDAAEKDFRTAGVETTEDVNAVAGLCDVLLAENRLSEFRERCRKCAELAAKDQNSYSSNTAAWTCSLMPDVGVDLPKLVDLMKKAVEDRPKSYAIRSTFGGLLYRNGNYQAAIDTLHEAMNLNKDDSADSTAPNKAADHDKDGSAFDWVVLAMAHCCLGHQKEAEKWLKQTDERLQSIDSDPIEEDPHYTWHWNDIVELRVLYKEADELLKSKSSPTSPAVSNR
jgi:WD40 repeat protein